MNKLFNSDNCEYSEEEKAFLNHEWEKMKNYYQYNEEKEQQAAKAYSNFIAQVYPNIWIVNVFPTKELESC